MFPYGCRRNDFCIAALPHRPCDEAVFRHSPDVQFAAAVRQWYDFLFGVERMCLNEVGQVAVATNNDIFDVFRIEERFFGGRPDDFLVRSKRDPGRHDGFHATQGQHPHIFLQVAKAFGIPHSIVKNEGMWLEFAFGDVAMAAPVCDAAYFVILPCLKQRDKNTRVDLSPIRGSIVRESICAWSRKSGLFSVSRLSATRRMRSLNGEGKMCSAMRAPRTAASISSSSTQGQENVQP